MRATSPISQTCCCSAFGETPELALKEALLAKTAWLAAAQTPGKLIPTPTYRPALYQTTT